jgi:hypothetical protein
MVFNGTTQKDFCPNIFHNVMYCKIYLDTLWQAFEDWSQNLLQKNMKDTVN